MKRNYVVAGKSPEDWGYIHNLLTESETSDNDIPSRSCECTNTRNDNDNRAIYLLEDDEVELLQSNPRVKYVELDEYISPNRKFSHIPASPQDRFPQDSKIYKQTQNTNSNQGEVSIVSPPNSFKHLSDVSSYTYPLVNEIEKNRSGYQYTRLQQSSIDFSYSGESIEEENITFSPPPYPQAYPQLYSPWYKGRTIKKPSNILSQRIQYENDGSNTDVIIVDDGVWMGHPEFVDSNGNRLVKDIIIDGPYLIDPAWFNSNPSRLRTYMGVTTPTDDAAKLWWTNSSNRSSQFQSLPTLSSLGNYNLQTINGSNTSYPTFGTSSATHGTASAGLVYGKTFGNAFNCNKWTILYPYEGDYPLTDKNLFLAIKIFHQNKPVSRPTLMNVGVQGVFPIYYNGYDPLSNNTTSKWFWKWRSSTGSFDTFDVRSLTGNTLTQRLNTVPKFLRSSPYSAAYFAGTFNAESSLTESNDFIQIVQELSSLSGVFIFVVGGNQRQKIVKDDHPDYNNYVSPDNGVTKYYCNRGGYVYGIKPDGYSESPIFCVGALDENIMLDESDNNYKERIAYYSVRGNRVDFYAPADDTLTAAGQPNLDCKSGPYFYPRYDGNPNDLNKAYSTLQVKSFDTRFNGTSAASPVATGWFATFLQNRPNWTALKLKKYIQNSLVLQSTTNFYHGQESTQGNSESQYDLYTLEGGEARVLYNAAVPTITITTHPTSQLKNQGTSVIFQVVATETTITGPLSYQWQRALAASPSSFSNISGATSSSYTFTTSASDNGNLYRCKVMGEYGVDDTFSNSATLTINRIPSDIIISTNSFNENISSNTVVASFSTSDPDGADTHTYTLTSGYGDNSSFSIINTNELRINSSPNYEVKSSYDIQVSSTDNGGLSLIKSFTLYVVDLNETPTDIVISSNSFNENISANTTVATFSATDPDVGNTHTYTLVSGTGSTDNSSFTITSNQLKINNSPNYEVKSSYSIRVRSTDSGGLYYEEQFTLNVVNLNESPTDISISSSSFNENISANTIVATFSTTDPDVGNTHTYTLVSGTGSTDNSSFTIVSNQLKINNSPDYETKSSYSIRVRSTDSGSGSLFFEKQFTLNVIDVDESVPNSAPTDIVISTNSFNENISANTTVATFSTTDSDAGDTHTYGLVSGTGSTDNLSFTIVSNELKINDSPEYETKSSYSIRIRTTDYGGLYYEKQFTLNVVNVNETPTDIVISSNSFNENISANTTVATFSTTDSDVGDTYTYTLVSGTGSTDNSSFTIVSDQLKINDSPDYETKSSYSIRVRSTDLGGLYYEEQFTLNVVNLNEAPTALSLSTISFSENIPAGSTVSYISVADPDITDIYTYSLVIGYGDNSYFSISGNRLIINTLPDYETKSSYNIKIRGTESTGQYDYEEVFTLNVIDIEEDYTTKITGNILFENIQLF